jgi:hypothetical protein
MGVPTSEVGYTSATTGRGDHEVHKGHVVALEKKNNSVPIQHEQADLCNENAMFSLRYYLN